MPAVERADACSDCEVERCFVGLQRELLDGAAAHAEVTRVDLGAARPQRLGDGAFGAIDREYVTAGLDAARHFASSCTWSTPDLEYAQPGAKG